MGGGVGGDGELGEMESGEERLGRKRGEVLERDLGRDL